MSVRYDLVTILIPEGQSGGFANIPESSIEGRENTPEAPKRCLFIDVARVESLSARPSSKKELGVKGFRDHLNL